MNLCLSREIPSRDPNLSYASMATGAAPNVLWRLYLSHSLSMWNSRMFEFGAVIFLAAIFPGTLFYASCYALFRAGAAALLSSSVGHMVDRVNRLRLIRSSIGREHSPLGSLFAKQWLIVINFSLATASRGCILFGIPYPSHLFHF